MAKLKDVCVINPKSPGFQDDLAVSFVPMPKVGENGEFDPSEIKEYREVKKGFTYFQNGDVLFAKITPCMENGKGAVARNLENGVGFGSTEFHVLRPLPERITSEWLYYLLSLESFRKDAEKNMTGSAGQKRVPKGFLEEYTIDVPALSKQKRMTETLDKICDLISLRKQQLAKLDELVKARFVELFGDPVLNPYGWDVVTIGDIVTDVRYGTSKPAVEGGKYPYLRMNNLTYDGHLDLSDMKYINIPDNEIEKCIVRKGDVLFNRTNSIELVGKTCVFDLDDDMVIAGYIIRVRLNDKLLPIVLSSYMNSNVLKEQLRNMAKGAVNQANINAQELQSIKIYLPPIELQNQFAAFVEQTDKSKLTVQQSLDKLELLKKSLMQQYFG